MTRRRIRRLCLAMLALFAMWLWQPTAHGLSIDPWITEHDWTVQIGEYRFGLVQSVFFDNSERTTDIHWGSGYARTEWLVPTIVIVGAAALAATIAVGGLILAALARRKTARPSSPDS